MKRVQHSIILCGLAFTLFACFFTPWIWEQEHDPSPGSHDKLIIGPDWRVQVGPVWQPPQTNRPARVWTEAIMLELFVVWLAISIALTVVGRGTQSR